MKRILLPGAAALAVVAAFIALSGWNRSDEPLLRITLTERELRLWNPVRANAGEDRGIELRFDYARRDEPLDARNWLTDERLAAIGLALNVPPSAPEAADTYGRSLPRVTWVAFEYDGEAWRDIERRRQLTQPPPRHPGGSPLEPSRLVPVDAAPDGAALAARHPQGHLILRASIKLGYVPPGQKGPLVYGWIRDIIPSAVHVPREFREVLASLPAPGEQPRYVVDLVVGRLGIPYVTALRPR